MNVETIQMDPRIARIYYADYLKKVRERRKERVAAAARLEAEAKKARIPKTQQEKEDLELLRAYRALSLGQRIINIQKVIWGVGLTNSHTPLLAIARASWEQVHFEVDWRHATFKKYSYVPHREKNNYLHLPYQPHGPARYIDNNLRNNRGWNNTISAVVPTIPAHLRPAGDLSDYWILWEAEWQHVAPKDPLLLKKIEDSDKFFVILAQWDLTPLEQQVLEGRFS